MKTSQISFPPLLPSYLPSVYKDRDEVSQPAPFHCDLTDQIGRIVLERPLLSPITLGCYPPISPTLPLQSLTFFISPRSFPPNFSTELSKYTRNMDKTGTINAQLGQMSLKNSKKSTDTSDKPPTTHSSQRYDAERAGHYDFKAKLAEAQETPFLDRANFTGPVETRKRSNTSHSRGFFLTKDVKAGELLFCEKPFSSVIVFNDTTPTRVTTSAGREVALNPKSERQLRDELSIDCFQKIRQKPSLAPAFADMSVGTYTGKPGSSAVTASGLDA